MPSVVLTSSQVKTCLDLINERLSKTIDPDLIEALEAIREKIMKLDTTNN